MTSEQKEELIALQYFDGKKDIAMTVLKMAYEKILGNKGEDILNDFLKKQYISRTPAYFENSYNHPMVHYVGGKDGNDKCNLSHIGIRYYDYLKDIETYFKSDLGQKKFYYEKRWLPFIISGIAAIIALSSLCVSIKTCNSKEKSLEKSAILPKK